MYIWVGWVEYYESTMWDKKYIIALAKFIWADCSKLSTPVSDYREERAKRV